MSPKVLKPREYCIDQCTSSDFFLFLLMIIIEQAQEYDQEDGMSLDIFTKNEKWDMDTLREEFSIATDHLYDTNDLILWQVLIFIEQFQLGKIEAVEIDDEEIASEDFVKKIITKNHKDLNSMELERTTKIYIMILHRLLSDKKTIAENKKHNLKHDRREYDDGRISLSKALNFDFSDLQPVAQFLPEHIYIKCKFDDDKIDGLVAEIYNHLFNFEDDSIYRLPSFDAEEAEMAFEQDLEEFYGFVAEQEKVFNTVAIPFSMVSKNGFNLVKILFYLIMDDAIEVNWSGENSIKVKLLKPTNIGVKSILNEKVTEKQEKLKSALSFNYQTSILTIEGTDIKIQGADQKELLKILFTSPNGLGYQWFFSEIAEEYDHQIKYDDKKFYNASYQLNKKVAEKSSVKDFLFTTQQTVKINEKYI